MNVKKSAQIFSIISLMLCVTMLIGVTFAWFTDTATTNVNRIQSGILDVQLVDEAGNDLEGAPLEFVKAEGAAENEPILWEPGCTYRLPDIFIKNNGNLSIKYKFVITGITGDAKLLEAIDFIIRYGEYEGNIDTFEGTLAPSTTSASALFIEGHMNEEAGNEYQGLTIEDISITVFAAQTTGEYDSYTNLYDENAVYDWDGTTATAEELAAVINDEAKTVQLATPEQLAAFAASVNNGNAYNGYTVTLMGSMNLGNYPWTPIGSIGNPFKGTFNGMGYTISNLRIIAEDNDNIGLFGYINEHATIKNIKLHNVEVSGSLFVGALVGRMDAGDEISGIRLTGSVKVSGGTEFVGGIAGYCYSFLVNDCVIDADTGSFVSGTGTTVGGIMGYHGENAADDGFNTTNCRSNIDVSGTAFVGGIVGIMQYGNTISGCVVTGNVTQVSGNQASCVGGIAGVTVGNSVKCKIIDCTYTGTITAANDIISNGGVVGLGYPGTSQDNLVISNCTVNGVPVSYGE